MKIAGKLWDFDGEIIPATPVTYVSAPRILNSKPRTFYTHEEADKLLAGKMGEIWRLFVNTGLRRGEGMMLRREWVKPDALQILSTDDDRTKSGKWREVPLSEGAREAIESIKGAEGYILPRMEPESLSRACIRESKRAGLTGSLHTLRHTYISHLVMAGFPIRTVQVLAGHSSITVTEKYAHLAPDHVAKAAIVSF